jgi:molybdopterin molybdotransferase
MEKSIKSPLISVDDAEKVICSESRSYGIEKIPIEKTLRRILAKPLIADRNFPPFDRVTMDGIAINFASFKIGNREFKIQSVQTAGDTQQSLVADNECIEVMTGAVLPKNTDTVIRYEDLEIANGFANICTKITQHQNVHFNGEDRKKGNVIVPENSVARPPEIAIAASIGATEIFVKKNPQILIITSGDELVPIEKVPEAYQIRTSNIYAIAATLEKLNLKSDFLHIADDLQDTQNNLINAIERYDILILSGGVSMGKKDFIPKALENIGVQKLFHKIAQTPGKPFWFGKKDEKLVFALPGNPVSSYLCMVRYVIPWLIKTLNDNNFEQEFAQLDKDFSIKNSLTYFLQVKLKNEKAVLKAIPIKGHGSGDHANLVDADAFLELPTFERNDFKKGEVFKVWRF